MADGLELGKKVGPLPMGAWIAVVGGGLALAYFVNRGQSAEPQLAAEPGVGTGLIPAGAGVEPLPSTEANETASTNAQWEQTVSNWLIAQGHDPGVSSNAVRKYLSGETLTLQEQSLINLALIVHGTPPEPLPSAQVPTTTPDVPAVSWLAPVSSIKRGTSFKLRGRITLNGESPGTRNLVRIQMYHSIYPANIPWSVYYVLTDVDGNFSTQSHHTNRKGSVRAEAHWKDLVARDNFSIT